VSESIISIKMPSREARFSPRNRELLAHASCVTAITDTLVGLCHRVNAASHKGGAHASNDLCSSGLGGLFAASTSEAHVFGYTLTDINVPGSHPDNTDGVGLNDSGQVVDNAARSLLISRRA
jgi:hypothetical protein